MAAPTVIATAAARRSILNVTGINRATTWLSSTRKWPRRFAFLGTAAVVSTAAIMWYDHPTLLPYRHRIVAAARQLPEIIHERRHGPRKKLLLQTVNRKILELGPGMGNNLQHYVSVDEWTGVEPNTAMKPYLAAGAARAGIPTTILNLHETNIETALASAPDAFYDSVVVDRMLCRSSNNYETILNHIHRVLRPGGRFYFMEYAANQTSPVDNALQLLWEPWMRAFGDGISLRRPIVSAIYSSPKWTSVYMEQWPHWRRPGASRDGIVPITYDSVAAVAPAAATTTTEQSSLATAAAAAAPAPAASAASASSSSASSSSSSSSSGSTGGRVIGLHGVRPLIAGMAVKANAIPKVDTAYIFTELQFDLPVSSI